MEWPSGCLQSQSYRLAVFGIVSSQQYGLQIFQRWELNAGQYNTIITCNGNGYTASSFCWYLLLASLWRQYHWGSLVLGNLRAGDPVRKCNNDLKYVIFKWYFISVMSILCPVSPRRMHFLLGVAPVMQNTTFFWYMGVHGELCIAKACRLSGVCYGSKIFRWQGHGHRINLRSAVLSVERCAWWTFDFL